MGLHILRTQLTREDGHDDLPYLIRMFYNNRIYGKNFTGPFEYGNFSNHVDIPRLKEGKVGGTFWSVFVPCPKDGTDFSDENYAASKNIGLRP